MKRAYGFTIVELLIVIVVIAILAALSVVVYRGIQDNAHKSVAESNLAQAKKKLSLYKAEYGSYPTTSDYTDAGVASPSGATYQYTSADGTTFCLTTTSASSNVAYKVTNSTSPSQGGCSDHSWPGGVAVTNMVVNGDLSNGADGWSMSSSGTSLGVVDGAYAATGNGANGIQVRFSTSPVSFVAGRVYYRNVTFRVTSSVAPSSVNFYAGSSFYTFSANVTLGEWQTVSSVGVQPAGNLGTRYINSIFTSAAEAGSATLSVKNAIIIDLTETFGGGNEPTKAQMDQLMQQFPNSYFGGTVTANPQGIL